MRVTVEDSWRVWEGQWVLQHSLLCPVQTNTWPQATFTALAEPPASSATVSVALRGMPAHALPPSTARHAPSVLAVVLPTTPLKETEMAAPGEARPWTAGSRKSRTMLSPKRWVTFRAMSCVSCPSIAAPTARARRMRVSTARGRRHTHACAY